MRTTFLPFTVSSTLEAKEPLALDVIHPAMCPLCGQGGSPALVHAVYHRVSRSASYPACCLYLCTLCKYYFIGYYSIDTFGRSPDPHFRSSAPVRSFSYASFADEIESISPGFVSIFKQAERAEHEGLNLVCGMAYRAALEHLVKDYLCSLPDADPGEIKSSKLSDCIARIPSDRLKSLARAASWLGNDFSHYERRHEEYALSDLKDFIQTAALWIASDLKASAAEEMLARRGLGQSRISSLPSNPNM